MNNEINVPRVRGGDPIRAADWNKIVDRINAGATGTVRPTLPKTPTRRELIVFNASANAIPPGGVARITGFKTAFETETDARNKILNDAIVLTVDEPRQTGDGSDDESNADFLVVATEPILPERVGAAKFCGACFFAILDDETEKRFTVVVRDENAGIALLVPTAPGLRFAVVAAAWTQNAARNAVLSAALNVDGSGAAISVQSPLSKSGDAFAVGTRIVVANIDGRFYLIQAECD